MHSLYTMSNTLSKHATSCSIIHACQNNLIRDVQAVQLSKIFASNAKDSFSLQLILDNALHPASGWQPTIVSQGSDWENKLKLQALGIRMDEDEMQLQCMLML